MVTASNVFTYLLDRASNAALGGFGTVSMPQLDRAFDKVRGELAEIGLLADGVYLDAVDCERAPLPSFDKLGYVYDRDVPQHHRLLGFRGGVIYVPVNARVAPRKEGHTLTDVVRHEFGHAWAWLDPRLFRKPWFNETFGARYLDEWASPPAFDPSVFVSQYATTSPAEDFAETFMCYLRYRNSLDRFARRRDVRRKMKAVDRAVKVAARALV